MTAGLNLLCEIWDYNYPEDDDIGGSQPSGTMLYSNVPIRIAANRPTQQIREQGIIGVDTYIGVVHNFTLDIENNNEILVTAPPSSHYYDKRFRVIGDVQRTSMGASDSRGYIILNLQRVERGRELQ